VLGEHLKLVVEHHRARCWVVIDHQGPRVVE
jgi:hypothetical protein